MATVTESGRNTRWSTPQNLGFFSWAGLGVDLRSKVTSGFLRSHGSLCEHEVNMKKKVVRGRQNETQTQRLALGHWPETLNCCLSALMNNQQNLSFVQGANSMSNPKYSASWTPLQCREAVGPGSGQQPAAEGCAWGF